MKLTTILLPVLLAAILTGCGNDTFETPDYYSRTASTRLGQQIIDGSGDYIGHVKSDSEVRPAKGVSLLRMGYLNRHGQAMQLFLYTVSLGTISIQVTTPDDEPAVGSLQLLTDQVAAIERKSVYTVWGAVTGDTFSASGVPTGIVYRNGTALKAEPDKGCAGLFAILNDGSAVCLPIADYTSVRPKIKEAVGGSNMLLKDGYLLPQSDATAMARIAVGVSEDGGTAYLLVVDGSDFYYSNGVTYSDLAVLMKGCGALNALSLNSGVNVTALWRNERLSSLFDLFNKPVNNALEADVANGLAIVER